MSNKKNKSGKDLEDRVELCIRSKFGNGYMRAQNGKEGIDFVVGIPPHSKMYIECKNQEGPGSAHEKWVNSIVKYHEKYGMDEMYLIRGPYEADGVKSSIRYCNKVADLLGVKLHIMLFGEFCDMCDYTPPPPPMVQSVEDFS